MAKPNYSAGKRQREIDKAKKKKDKEARKRDRSLSGDGVPIATVEELQGGAGMMSQEQVLRGLSGDTADDGSGPGGRTIPSRLFVGGLDWSIGVDQLRERFEKVGRVNDAVVVYDRDTGDSRGFGFVTMADRKDAAEAIRQLDGRDFDGRSMVVRQATERGR